MGNQPLEGLPNVKDEERVMSKLSNNCNTVNILPLSTGMITDNQIDNLSSTLDVLPLILMNGRKDFTGSKSIKYTNIFGKSYNTVEQSYAHQSNFTLRCYSDDRPLNPVRLKSEDSKLIEESDRKIYFRSHFLKGAPGKFRNGKKASARIIHPNKIGHFYETVHLNQAFKSKPNQRLKIICKTLKSVEEMNTLKTESVNNKGNDKQENSKIEKAIVDNAVDIPANDEGSSKDISERTESNEKTRLNLSDQLSFVVHPPQG